MDLDGYRHMYLKVVEPVATEDNKEEQETTEPEAKEESVPEPEPEVTEEPVAAETTEAPVDTAPPMPDLSDPNKTLSPDEIAALFANMGN